MGANFENIDRAFRSGLKNYQHPAPDDVWANIEMQLNEKNKFNWLAFYKIAAAVLAFAVIGSLYFYLSYNKEKVLNETNSIIAQFDDHNKLSEKPLAKEQTQEIQTQEEIAPVQNEVKIEAKVQKSTFKKEEKKTLNEELIERDNSLEKLLAYEIAVNQKKIDYSIVDKRKELVRNYLNSLNELNSILAYNEVPVVEKGKSSNWSVGGEFTPLYSYRYISQSSGSYSKDFYNQTEGPVMSYTGGVNVQYKAFNKLSIQAGVYYSSMGQSLDYMSVYSNHAYDLVADDYKDRYVNSYNIENSTGDLSFNSKYVIVDNKSARVENLSDNKGVVDLSNPLFNNMEADIQQSFKYIEVPFLLRYKLIDKNIDLNIVGGIGANFLIGNDVYIIYGDNKEIIGKTDGVNNINYSSTIGFGIEYPVWNRINIRVEPSLKYYINSINPGADVQSHPYSFGLFTGINYSF